MKYKIGDLVTHKLFPHWGIGIIIETHKCPGIYLKIFWPKKGFINWHGNKIIKEIILKIKNNF
jgi:hypothetical protein